MRVLVDIVHPAHAHFYRHLIGELQAEGHHVAVVSRDKDVTLELLDRFGIDHTPVGRAAGNSLFSLIRQLSQRVGALRRIGRAFGADLVLTRNPAGVQAARLLRIPGVFDTDDGAAAGIHWKAAVPFATHITMPRCLQDDHRRKRIAYPSYKALAYLHPDRFTPDPSVLGDLGMRPDERYFVVRFVSMTASHDRSEQGIPLDARLEVVSRLRDRGRVFISTEGEVPLLPGVEPLQVPAHRIHDVLAHSALLVGDSQTMAAEAAVLGVPSVRLSSWAGRLAYLADIESRYGLTFEFPPERADEFLDEVDALSVEEDPSGWARRRSALLADHLDLTSWYREFVLERFA